MDIEETIVLVGCVIVLIAYFSIFLVIGYYNKKYFKKITEHERIQKENEEKELRARNRRLKAGKTKLVKKVVTKPCIIKNIWGTAPQQFYIDPLDYYEHMNRFYMTIQNPNGTTETKEISETAYHLFKEGESYGTMEVVEEVEVPIK